MALRNAFGALALESTLTAIRTWVEARTGAKTTANSISVNIASDQTVPVSGPLTDTQLRATPVPVSGTVAISNSSVEIANDAGNPVPVSGTVTATGPLTDTQLRASAVPVSAASLPLPSGAATAANQGTANASLASIDGKAPALVGGRVPVDGSGVTQPVSASSLPLPSGAATSANQTTANTSLSSIDGKLPALSGGNVPVVPAVQLGMGVATATTQRVTLATDGAAVTALTSIDGKTPALVSGRQPVDGSGVTQPISAASLPLPTGAATQATLASVDGKLPALDTGSVPVLVKNGQLEITNDTGNPLPIGPAAQVNVTGSASANNTDLISVACDAYRSVSFQLTGTWSGTITFQVSNDNVNWNSTNCFNAGGTTPSLNSTSNAVFYAALVGYQFFRARFTAYTSGTASITAFFSREIAGTAIIGNGLTIANLTASTSSSATVLYTVNSAATTNAANIKASGANLYGLSVMNTSASTKYVRLFNLATAPTMGTSVPIMVVAVPATSSKEIEYVPALRFGTGLAVAITGGAAATDATAVAAGDVQLLVSYL